MKFSFAIIFLTLTATSAVVFAIPTQGDSATRYLLYCSSVSHRYAYQSLSEVAEVPGVITFSEGVIGGHVLGKKLDGSYTTVNHVPFSAIIDSANYEFHTISDLLGEFIGTAKAGKLFINYEDGTARISGKYNEANEDSNPITIKGATWFSRN